MPAPVQSNRMKRLLLVLCIGSLLFAGAALAQPPAEPRVARALVPVVGSVPGGGGTLWRTEILLTNPTGADLFVVLRLVSDPEESFFSTLIPAGESLGFSDVSQEAFGRFGILSPLLIQTLGDRSVIVHAFSFGEQQGRISAPQQIPVIYGPLPRAVMYIGPVTSDEEFRTNLGLVNIGDEPVSFTVSIQRLPGRNLAVNTLTVNPRSMVHSTLASLFPLLEEVSGVTIVVDPTAANTYAYASTIRLADNQARFFAPH